MQHPVSFNPVELHVNDIPDFTIRGVSPNCSNGTGCFFQNFPSTPAHPGFHISEWYSPILFITNFPLLMASIASAAAIAACIVVIYGIA